MLTISADGQLVIYTSKCPSTFATAADYKAAVCRDCSHAITRVGKCECQFPICNVRFDLGIGNLQKVENFTPIGTIKL